MAVNTRDWTFTSKISAMPGTRKKATFLLSSLIYFYFFFGNFSLNGLYDICRYFSDFSLHGCPKKSFPLIEIAGAKAQAPMHLKADNVNNPSSVVSPGLKKPYTFKTKKGLIFLSILNYLLEPQNGIEPSSYAWQA